MLLVAQGWQDHDDADALRHDPTMRLAVSFSAGLTPLTGEAGLASQPTLSRFTAMLACPENLKVLRKAAMELAGRNMRAENSGARRPRITLDVDSLPIEIHDHQGRGHMRKPEKTCVARSLHTPQWPGHTSTCSANTTSLMTSSATRSESSP